jgi:hypothetical protein
MFGTFRESLFQEKASEPGEIQAGVDQGERTGRV